MKKLNIISLFIAFCIMAITHFAAASDGKFEEVMKKNIEAVYKAQSVEEYRQAINAFERIASIEKKRWEPHYYSAFGYIMLSMRETENNKKDDALDQALQAVKKAADIAGEDSEIVALEGFVHMMRVSVDPGSRGPQYAALAQQTLTKAVTLNPENPRALALLGQMQYGTAQFFGSSTIEACNNVRKALEKFDAFKSENVLAPVWGKHWAESVIASCK